ncbi:MAG: SMC-Scp complex subunit ScpB [Deltaproteobacteria bacterium]|nr:SMC-Scp complex subunit ScpB [Deltaproteobacteria bacterium]
MTEDKIEQGDIADGDDIEAEHREHGEINVISVIESLLFVADRPLGIKELKKALGGDVPSEEIRDAIDTITGDYSHGDRGIILKEVAGGWRFRTNPANKEWVRKFLSARPQRLSRAALETLSIIAYRQPVIRAEIEEIRGVDSSGAIKTLLERGLLRILGRKDEVGRPLIYGTSREFLEFFGLKDLKGLPTLKDLEELEQEHGQGFEEDGSREDAGQTDEMEQGQGETEGSQSAEEDGHSSGGEAGSGDNEQQEGSKS